jgi:hypothetical protein
VRGVAIVAIVADALRRAALCAAVAVPGLLAAYPRPASAAVPPPTLRSNDYSIEIYQGPILAPIHVTGVGGAYVASAEGTEGSAANAAAPAVRQPYSTTWFDYDLSAGISLPGAFARTDFDNHGDFANLPNQPRAGDFLDLNVGTTLQFGPLGVAGTGDLQQFTLTTTTPRAPVLSLEIGRWTVLGAYAFFDGQLALGGGARILTLQINQNGGGALLTMTGASPEVGALWMPTGLQWRLGATLRGPVSGGAIGKGDVGTDRLTGAKTAGSFVLPSEVEMPWEGEVGLAYQLGPRPLNPGWENPHDQEAYVRARIAEDRATRAAANAARVNAAPPEARAALAERLDAEEKTQRTAEDRELANESERLHKVRKARYANWPRERILLLASVLFTGPSDRAISLEGFLDQRSEAVGRSLNASPRFGVEGEPLRDRIIVRGGTYVEPSRYEGAAPRQHFTFGGDVRLLPLDFWGLFPDAEWKVSVLLDIAPRYTNGGIGIGLWH